MLVKLMTFLISYSYGILLKNPSYSIFQKENSMTSA